MDDVSASAAPPTLVPESSAPISAPSAIEEAAPAVVTRRKTTMKRAGVAGAGGHPLPPAPQV